ncbi:hypothetical protein AYO45_02740 [Gammaproteobacteria bacterium SCGC AG-212-F23]|nr:hypothetical protein AYO45_02740 [Gammaproteobacteria bacterium SCGC AG-212-F23]
MRSRYTAYTKANIDYIARTMKGTAKEGFDKAAAKKWAQQVTWLSLKILNTSTTDTHATVEFIATYSQQHHLHQLHEISQFEYENGQWYYTNGRVPYK